MTAYLYLVLSTFCNAAKGYASKRVSTIITKPFANAKLNAIRSLLCCVIALVILLVSGDIAHIGTDVPGILIAAASGIATAVFLMSWLSAVREGAYMMVGAFGSASFVVPLLGGLFILGEQLTLRKVWALMMITAAILLMCRYNNKIKAKLTVRMMIYLFLVMLMQGISQFLQKLFTSWSASPIASVYSFYTFLFSGLTLMFFTACLKKSETEDTKLPRKAYMYIVLMAAALLSATYLQTLAAKAMEASLMYPLLNVLSMLANMFMSTLLFGEKIRIESIVGIGLVLGAVLLYL